MNLSSLFRCPVCKSVLFEEDAKYACENNHSFDKSKYGYVNLLMSQTSSSKRHGDDKTMVISRREFLNKGYYEPLLKTIEKTVNELEIKPKTAFDIGCGEGYYINSIKEHCGISNVYGIDISKDALRFASRLNKNIHFAVASAFSLPFGDLSTDLIFNIFAPCSYEEFYRILKNQGYLIKVVPLSEHLWELKKLVYDIPYKNKPEIKNEELFNLITSKELKYTITLTEKEDIFNLFTMTPYYYKTSKEDTKKLLEAENLTTTVHFLIEIYEKRK